MKKIDRILMVFLTIGVAYLVPILLVASYFFKELILPLQIFCLVYLAGTGINELTKALNSIKRRLNERSEEEMIDMIEKGGNNMRKKIFGIILCIMLFLSLLPIASGDPDNPDGWTTCFFRDKATVENQVKMLENEAKRVGASRAINVSTTMTDESFLSILFLREKCHTSAVLVK